jgi:dihydropyrimidine dehydrogenase (NAD+) subunit PreT
VHGSRCVGHGLCATECPTGGIQVALADLETREDIPILHENWEVQGQPGLYLAGEVTGYALIKTAITHGSAVAEHAVANLDAQPKPSSPPQRTAAMRSGASSQVVAGTGTMVARATARKTHTTTSDEIEDLVIIGAGPAGLSCALKAKELGVDALVLEQSTLGGTVSKYPRRKLVMTQPVELPLHGRLKRTSYQKEELMEIWEGIATEQNLRIRTGEVFAGMEACADGSYEVRTQNGTLRARKVVLCLGRRGTPRKLGVPGEDLPKVVYDLVDAASYENRNILVVGGGDSAIEAAVALSEQEGNQVTLSYRKHAFFRIKPKNEKRLEQSIAQGKLNLLFSSQVQDIDKDSVTLEAKTDEGAGETHTMPNDDVFVFAGGIPPFDLLKNSGVSFDPKLRKEIQDLGEKGTGILKALGIGFAISLLALLWFQLFRGYYELPVRARPDNEWHEQLKPTSILGVIFGVSATGLICLNLLYLLRRSRIGEWVSGTLQYWLSLHMVTGLLAMVLLLLHSGMEIRNNPGGHAFIGVIILVVTGGIGRYIYSYIPKAANGQESVSAEAKDQMQVLLGEWDQASRPWGRQIQQELDKLIQDGLWDKPAHKRALALLTSRFDLHRSLKRLAAQGRAQGLADTQIQQILDLAKRLQKTALMASNLEGIRGLLSSWRFLHRWIALGMVLLAIVHIVAALRFAHFG